MTRDFNQITPTHLAKGTLSYERVNLITTVPFLSSFHYVVVILIIIAVIVQTFLFLVVTIGVVSLLLLRSAFLFSIVNLHKQNSATIPSTCQLEKQQQAR